jgi:adenosylcobyric acid synthase
MVEPGDIIPIDADLILIPGTKSTIGDLAFLRKQGWDIDIASHVRRGGRVMGLCGGYQLMGKKISDPEGIEGAPATIEGLGLLNIETVLTSKKSLECVVGMDTFFDKVINGYEIHIGRTSGPDCLRPILNISSGGGCIRTDGASSSDGRITGSYVHGIFSSDDFRRAFLCNLGMIQSNTVNFNYEIDVTLDRLAAHLGKYIDIKCLFELAR